MLKRLRVLALLAATALAGCASVDATDIQKFGVATAAVAQAARDARTIDNTLARAYATEGEAALYVSEKGTYNFPPPNLPRHTTDVAWDPRIAYALALADYGEALALAANGVQGADIGTAVDNLQAAFTASAPKLAARKNFESVANATVVVAKRAITQVAWNRIKEAMQRAHPSIVRGRDLLAADFAKVGGRAKKQYEIWLGLKEAALAAVRSTSSGKERYDAYRAFLLEQQGLAASIDLLVPVQRGQQPGYVALLDNMVAAHKSLADGAQDPAALSDFLAIAQQFEAISEIFAVKGGL